MTAHSDPAARAIKALKALVVANDLNHPEHDAFWEGEYESLIASELPTDSSSVMARLWAEAREAVAAAEQVTA